MHIHLRKTLRKNFGVRVFAVYAVFIVAVSFCLTAFFVQFERRSLTDTLIDRGKLLSGILAYSSRSGVFSKNKVLLENPINSVFLQDDVMEAAVFDLNGGTLVEQKRSGMEQKESAREGKIEDREVFIELERTGSPYHVEQDDRFQFWAPIIAGAGYSGKEIPLLEENPRGKNNGVIGFVRVTVDREILNRRLTGLFFRTILIGPAFLFVSFGVAYVVVRGLTKPLRRLTESVGSLEMGEKIEEISAETEDEIGRIAGAFSRMSELLEKSGESLRESEERRRFLTSELFKAQEKERKRLSRELHDELGQALAVFKYRLRSIQRGLEHQSSLWEECEEASQYVDEIIENVRRVSRDLSPSILEDLGLSAALKWLLEDYRKRHSISTSFKIDNIDHLFSQEAQTNLYRISQEALTNIGRHSGASGVDFTVKRDGRNVSFVVTDDGRGFDVDQVKAGPSHEKGIGLATMEERAYMLGAVLDVRSQREKGTKIVLKIPLEGEE